MGEPIGSFLGALRCSYLESSVSCCDSILMHMSIDFNKMGRRIFLSLVEQLDQRMHLCNEAEAEAETFIFLYVGMDALDYEKRMVIWWAGLMRGVVSIALAFKQFTNVTPAWIKDQVVLDPKATPPSTIQMIGENKTAPKLQSKRKNVYVSRDTMQKQARKKSQKSLNYCT
ncbi:phosphatidylinositol 3,4,5-trisphosphate 3-phosphatase and protein-tyrosine-phosphatase PTEN2A-like protein [Tanacetum coccineum]